MDRKYPATFTPVERVRALRASRVEQGLCADCGDPRQRAEIQRCEACASARAASAKTHAKATTPDERRAYLRRIKAEVVAAYGGTCACCGEGNLAFLTIDHIHRDGAAHRRELTGNPRTGGPTFYVRLRELGYPQGRLRVLCWNCNVASWQLGECPHNHQDTTRR